MANADTVVSFIPRGRTISAGRLDEPAKILQAEATLISASARLVRLYDELSQMALPDDVTRELKEKIVELLTESRNVCIAIHCIENIEITPQVRNPWTRWRWSGH